MKITLDKIVGVFLSEYNGKIDEVDLPILKEHNLYDIRNYLALENPSPKEQKVIDLFNRYYLNQPDGGENEK